MAHGQFIVSDTNPNDNMGGGGCVCDPRKQIDCKPPYIVCYANDMEDARSPHVVICQNCVCRMSELLGGESLSAGERNTIQAIDNTPRPPAQQESREIDAAQLVKPRRKAVPEI